MELDGMKIMKTPEAFNDLSNDLSKTKTELYTALNFLNLILENPDYIKLPNLNVRITQLLEKYKKE